MLDERVDMCAPLGERQLLQNSDEPSHLLRTYFEKWTPSRASGYGKEMTNI